jgi:hypothetical protein
VLISPINSPRLRSLVKSKINIIAILINPPLPNPVTARPNRKIAREGAAAVMKRPIARMVLEKTKQRRAVKIAANRPASGVTLEAAIFK